MQIIRALDAIWEDCVEYPLSALASIALVYLMLIVFWLLGGSHPLIATPPTLACWMFGRYLRLLADGDIE